MKHNWVLLLISLMASPVLAQSTFTFTSDEDFDRGLLLNVNHEQADQIQLNGITKPLPFITVTNAARGTIARVNTTNGDVVGEYRTAPQGFDLNPSRATVDLWGNVWAGNRNENGGINGTPHGSVVKIGMVTGGHRANSNGAPQPNGDYLAGPFDYNSCLDRDGDGLIRTSRGLGDILDWVNSTDGAGGSDGTGHGLVQDATDECVLVYQRTPDADGVRHISIDRNNDVWVGGYPEPIYTQRSFLKLGNEDGRILDSFDARPYGAGGYGGFVDDNGILWSVGFYQNKLLRYDPATHTGSTISISGSYGLGIDANGFVWNTTWFNNSIVKISPDGVVETGFPRPTGGDSFDRGVAITPADNHVWVANSGATGGTTVSRLDNDGNLLKVITVGTTPVGVAVDADGKIWVTNRDSNNLLRIDPKAGADGLGEVDLTVELGLGAGPYNYSDTTGIVALGNTARQGGFSVVQDGTQPQLQWDQILWNTEPEGSVPPGTSITIEARAGDNLAALPGVSFFEVENGISLNGQAVGRFLEVRASLRFAGDISPVFSDLVLVSIPATVACDFSGDALCDITDLDLMQALGPLATGVSASGNEQFDLNGDGTINLVDRDRWLADAAAENSLALPYKRGDANLDGFVDGQDFLIWNFAKFTSSLLFSDGNFNGDTVVDGQDFLDWNVNKFTSSNRASTPEPPTGLSAIFALIVLGITSQRS